MSGSRTFAANMRSLSQHQREDLEWVEQVLVEGLTLSRLAVQLAVQLLPSFDRSRPFTENPRCPSIFSKILKKTVKNLQKHPKFGKKI